MFVKVSKTDEFADGLPKLVERGDKQIAIFKVENSFYALQNQCPHRGGPLAEGDVQDFIVTCPWHAWGFDVRSGKCQSAPDVQQPSFKVKVEGSDIFVDIP